MTPEKASAYTIDKSDMGSGPWIDEPDRIDFHYRGYPCLILRNWNGVLCGYVGVPPTHPWYGLDYYLFEQDHVINEVRVHGGLTYANKCAGDICHVPAPGESDLVWWFGFDCGHSGDLIPIYYSREYSCLLTADSVYRTIEYVRSQVEKLAKQIEERVISQDGNSNDHARRI